MIKKHAYFTVDNISTVSKELLTEVEAFKKRHDYNFNLQNSALLVIDPQNIFLQKDSKKFIPSMPAIVNRIKLLQELYFKHNCFIIHTEHIDTTSGLMANWWQSTIAPEDQSTDLILELTNKQIPILQKSQYDAFLNTDLEKQLRKNNIKQVVIVGVMANLCCETTARSAFMRGFEVFFAIDGTAANNIAFHRASLLNLAYGFATPVLIDELLAYSSK